MDHLYLIVGALVAEIIGTLIGFGSSTLFLPFALFFVDFKTALALTAILHISGNVSRIGFFKKGIQKNLLIWFGIPSVLFTMLGAILASVLSPDFFKQALGVFLIMFVIASFIKSNIQLPKSKGTAITGGAISGLVAGVIGTGGAIRGAWLTGFNLEKAAYIGTAAAIAFAVDFTRLPIYLYQGFLSFEYVPTSILLIVAAICGSLIGKALIEKVPQKMFRMIVLCALFVMGVQFLFFS